MFGIPWRKATTRRMHREAVEASRQALALARKKRTYYEDQLDKFSNAAGDLKLKIED